MTELYRHHETYRGVHPIVPTAFRDDGSFDPDSQRRLVDYLVQIGVHGVAILGFLGEAHKLTEPERHQVIETVMDQAAGRLKVLVGVRALGTAGAIAQAASCCRCSVRRLMVTSRAGTSISSSSNTSQATAVAIFRNRSRI